MTLANNIYIRKMELECEADALGYWNDALRLPRTKTLTIVFDEKLRITGAYFGTSLTIQFKKPFL